MDTRGDCAPSQRVLGVLTGRFVTWATIKGARMDAQREVRGDEG